LVDGPLLILNLGGAGTAVNKATGKVAWTSDKDPGGYATPVPFYAAGDRCVAIFSSKALVAVKAKNGQELWRFKWETKWDINAVDPLLIADKLFISSFDRGCALLQLGAGAPKVLWQNKNMGNHFNSCVYWRGCVYGIDGQTDAPPKELRCLEAATGRIKWQHSGLGLGSLLAADGKLLIMSDKGELMVADAIPDGLRPLAQAQVLGGKCWTVPVLAHRRIYCRNAQGTVVCLDVSGGVNKPAGPRVTAP
jgi:outer membrane protein assembly factor BamB